MSLPKLNKFPVEELSCEQVNSLKEAAKRARVTALTMITAANSGHPAGAFSSMEMFLSVYGVADLTPENCNSNKRDYVVISHGHTSAGVYAALCEWGFVNRDEVIANFRRCGSAFQGHVTREVPGIDWGTGNLGQGLSVGVGFALAQKEVKHEGRVYVLMGDGGQTKGQISEARRLAIKEGLNNITVLIDWNHIQISGRIEDVMPCNIRALWEADGWEVVECDGHSFPEIYAALKNAGKNGKPTVLLCHTIMGKDGGAMENIPTYHGKPPSAELYKQIMQNLGAEPVIPTREDAKLYEGRNITLPEKPSLDLGQPITYKGKKISDNRGAFGKALADVGRLNYDKTGKTPIIVFDCDLASSVMTAKFKEECPNSFIQSGIQEHNTATVSGAASIAGVVPVWADFGVFGIDEVYNQQRLNDINHAGCKTVLTHVGLDVGEDGKTHQCIDYVGLMRNMFGWKLVVPADPNQTDRATRWMLSTPGCICLAMGRSKLDALEDSNGNLIFDKEFEYGKAVKIRNGKDGSIFALGAMTHRVLDAAEILSKEGINITVWSVSSPLEPDINAIKEAVNANKPILTVEDHHVDTGMGAIMALTASREGLNLHIKTLGVTRYGKSGPAVDVYDDMGLSVKSIAEAFRESYLSSNR